MNGGDAVQRSINAGQPVVIVEPITPLRAIKITLAVVFVLGLVWVLIQIREIVLLVVFGALLAAALDPIVNRMRRRGLSRGQSILVIYAAILLAVIGGMVLVAPPLFEQGQVLVAGLPTYLDQFRARAAASEIDLVRQFGPMAIDRAERILANLRENPPLQASQISQALSFLGSFVGIVFTTVSALIVAYYWMTERAIIKRLALSLFPLDRRDRAHAIWDEIEDRLGGWARGQVVLMLIIGVTSTIVYAVLGLPYWFLLGIWAGVTELIPFVGPFLGGGLAVLVALTDSWQKALVVLGFVFILQQLEGNVVVPRVMRNAVGLTPLSVILALLVGSALLGLVGAILAIPVAAAVQVLVSELLRAREETDDDTVDGVGDRSSAPITAPEPTGVPLTTMSRASLLERVRRMPPLPPTGGERRG